LLNIRSSRGATIALIARGATTSSNTTTEESKKEKKKEESKDYSI
jgi:hypothetical protein